MTRGETNQTNKRSKKKTEKITKLPTRHPDDKSICVFHAKRSNVHFGGFELKMRVDPSHPKASFLFLFLGNEFKQRNSKTLPARPSYPSLAAGRGQHPLIIVDLPHQIKIKIEGRIKIPTMRDVHPFDQRDPFI